MHYALHHYQKCTLKDPCHDKGYYLPGAKLHPNFKEFWTIEAIQKEKTISEDRFEELRYNNFSLLKRTPEVLSHCGIKEGICLTCLYGSRMEWTPHQTRIWENMRYLKSSVTDTIQQSIAKQNDARPWGSYIKYDCIFWPILHNVTV